MVAAGSKRERWRASGSCWQFTRARRSGFGAGSAHRPRRPWLQAHTARAQSVSAGRGGTARVGLGVGVNRNGRTCEFVADFMLRNVRAQRRLLLQQLRAAAIGVRRGARVGRGRGSGPPALRSSPRASPTAGRFKQRRSDAMITPVRVVAPLAAVGITLRPRPSRDNSAVARTLVFCSTIWGRTSALVFSTRTLPSSRKHRLSSGSGSSAVMTILCSCSSACVSPSLALIAAHAARSCWYTSSGDDSSSSATSGAGSGSGSAPSAAAMPGASSGSGSMSKPALSMRGEAM